ncbi:MAG: hypothetical protein ACYDCL_13420 [Myxococcales bacterium]
MNESFAIDLDAERVAVDGAWYTKADLAGKIKEMVDGGDFRVARPSAALEALEQALASLTSLTLKLPAATYAALSGAAARSGRTAEALARELLERSIAAPQSGGQVTSPPMALQSPPVPLTAVVGGAAAEGAPISLTPKRPVAVASPPAPAPAAVSEAESGWFKKR